MRNLLLLLVLSSALFATVDGTVLNRTTGKPQAGATVTLYQLGQAGMDSVESVKSDAQGKFTMDRTPQGPHLIQTAFDGVTYNHMLPPGTPATGLALEVYNSSKKPGDAKVSQHMLLLEPSAGAIAVSETIIYQNAGTTTFDDPAGGTFHFYLPQASKGEVRVMAKAPQGMPIQRKAEPAAQPGIYKVDFPIKPGETQFDLTYQLPAAEPAEFSTKILHKEGMTRLVVPNGVKLQGNDLELLGQEPRTQASIYNIKGADLKVTLEGTGTLRPPAGAAGGEDDRPQIQQILPRVYDRMYVILGLVLAILAGGFYLFFRADAAAPVKESAAAPQKGKRRA